MFIFKDNLRYSSVFISMCMSVYAEYYERSTWWLFTATARKRLVLIFHAIIYSLIPRLQYSPYLYAQLRGNELMFNQVNVWPRENSCLTPLSHIMFLLIFSLPTLPTFPWSFCVTVLLQSISFLVLLFLCYVLLSFCSFLTFDLHYHPSLLLSIWFNLFFSLSPFL